MIERMTDVIQLPEAMRNTQLAPHIFVLHIHRLVVEED